MRASSLGLFLLAFGCGGEEETAPGPCVPPSRVVAGRCLVPGVQDDGCPAGMVGLPDGGCQPAGIPPELCGEGFEPDGDAGCEPVLPAEPCPPRLMAVPGDTDCSEVIPCGAGKWGDIPVDATTVYVDGSYAGAGSDGSATKPWTTITAAVAAAAPGAIVAVAAGSYVEDVVVFGKAVRLWGKCPEEVEVVGTGAAVPALVIAQGAQGSEVHALAAAGGGTTGIAVFGVEDVLVEAVWVHDVPGPGIGVLDDAGASTSATVRRALVEQNHDVGVVVMGSDASFENVVVRGTLPQTGTQELGWGIAIQDDAGSGAHATALVRGSIVEQNRDSGVFVWGSEATLADLVVRDTASQESDQQGGRGIDIQAHPGTGTRATVLVRGSIVERSHDAGVIVVGSDVTLEGLLVRDTFPRDSDQTRGRGIGVEGDFQTDVPATISVHGSLLEHNHETGALIALADTSLEGLLVRATLPQDSDQLFGMGIFIAGNTASGARGNASLHGVRVEQSHHVGVWIHGADAMLEGVYVGGTEPAAADGSFGDGVVITSPVEEGVAALASATMQSCHIEQNGRAGVANFGATARLESTALSCNAFDLEGEVFLIVPFTFENLGGNGCGCPEPSAACVAQSLGVHAPEVP
jgi:hypothetical protein